MKETGIIMSSDHPLKCLDGTKTITRRTMGLNRWNIYPDTWIIYANDFGTFTVKDLGTLAKYEIKCPYGQVGDRLWVRETWAVHLAYDLIKPSLLLDMAGKELPVYYKNNETFPLIGRWRSSIHMPRWVSRILLEITEVRVGRLQEITEEDAIKEGCKEGITKWDFRTLWDSLNAKRGYGWNLNKWVWPISFKLLEASSEI